MALPAAERPGDHRAGDLAGGALLHHKRGVPETGNQPPAQAALLPPLAAATSNAPDTWAAPAPRRNGEATQQPAAALRGSFAEAVRTRRYWTINLGLTLVVAAVVGVVSNTVPILRDLIGATSGSEFSEPVRDSGGSPTPAEPEVQRPEEAGPDREAA